MSSRSTRNTILATNDRDGSFWRASAQPQAAANQPATIADPKSSTAPPGQPDYRQSNPGNPRAEYRNDPRPDSQRGNPPDYRGIFRAEVPTDLRGTRPADVGGRNPSIPAATADVVPPPTAPEQPGVARTDGTYGQPSVRTTYDRARPGVY